MVARRKIEVHEPAGCLTSSWSGDALMNPISQEILRGPIVVITVVGPLIALWTAGARCKTTNADHISTQ
jgi:hypothetical protein